MSDARAKAAEALQALYDDCAEYITINHLCRSDGSSALENQVMRQAREALAAEAAAVPADREALARRLSSIRLEQIAAAILDGAGARENYLQDFDGLIDEAIAALRQPAAEEVEDMAKRLLGVAWIIENAGIYNAPETIREASAFIRRLSPPADGWRPIESAPRTGEFIWAYLYNTGIRQVRWMAPNECAELEGGTAADYDGSWVEAGDREDWSPRFWLPIDALPAPPSSEEATA